MAEMKALTVDQNESICRLMMLAGRQARHLGQQSFEVYEKGVEDYVTSVDQMLDRQLSAGVSDLFPQDGVITEENEGSRREFHKAWQRLWLIDPIDGTAEFINQGDGYAVMLGVLEAYQPKAGWVYAPARDCLYWGGPDWGLFWTQQNNIPQPLQARCPPPPAEHYCPILLGYRDQNRFGQAIAAHLPMAQCYSLGSFGLKVLEVIQGKAGLYLYLNRRVKLWDTTGPIALALAAGLVCCDLEGRPLEFSPTMVEKDTLIHQQTVLIGWPSYVEQLLPLIRRAVSDVLLNQA
ncbi:MAG: inositol monophosphatase family protein [Cyanobacteria bacterium P01_A01_bin.114]